MASLFINKIERTLTPAFGAIQNTSNAGKKKTRGIRRGHKAFDVMKFDEAL
jgi:hypothetical protein